MPYDMITLAVDIFNVVENAATRFQDIGQTAAIAAGIIIVVIAYIKTRALVPVLTALLIAGFMVWGANSMPRLQESTDTTIDGLNEGG